MNTTKLVKELAKIANGVSFVGINYTNQQNEKSQYLINVGASLKNAKLKDIDFLKSFDVTSIKEYKGLDVEAIAELDKAKNALLKALISPNKNRSNGQKNAYTHIVGAIKMHNETNDLFVFGFKQKKTIEILGEYKKTEFAYEGAKPLTRAKNFIKVHYFKSSKFRQFKIDKEQAHNFKLNKETITFG